ncbi:MAG: CoA-binding protein [Bacteroidetes bacterium]|nr:MAG: CoA-binding protein [Bacteroidota bacterium]
MKTLVIGASEKINRYSNKAVRALNKHGFEVIAFGPRLGQIDHTAIENTWNPDWEVDTVTLYINPLVQESYEDNILKLQPRRVIFNPGTENSEFEEKLEQAGIETLEACTLVMLATGQY